MTIPPSPLPARTAAAEDTRVKRLSFAFPFLRNGQGAGSSATHFSDEHEIYQRLANSESAGAYLVGRLGLWHGGIHITASGFGRHIDLAAGVRCIADGEVVAFRINRSNPTSKRPGNREQDATVAEYSTGFVLVRHTMAFPTGKTLTFNSLYMHLMSYDDYRKPKHVSWMKPAYWPQQWEVTKYAQDLPARGRRGQTAAQFKQGLRVRAKPNGRILAILPQGARVTLDSTKNGWGKLKAVELNGASLYPSHIDGYAPSSSISNGWISLGQENGGPLVHETMPDDIFDTVQVPGTPIPIKAGDLVGHLGRYDRLEPGCGPNSQVHIETFTPEDIDTFIETCCDWVTHHGPHKDDWAPLGLPAEPTILRIASGTTLYERQGNTFTCGVDPQARKTGLVQTYAMPVLGRDKDRTYTEPEVDRDARRPVNWWNVKSVDMRGNPVEGWVRDFNHSPGRVTREFPQKWVDFKCISEDHAPTNTIFADTANWIDFVTAPNASGAASRAKLSPTMQTVYDSIFTEGHGEQAAIQLRDLSAVSGDGYPWRMQAASRLIVKHESEWAVTEKWAALFAALKEQTGAAARLDEEKKRIENLIWWEAVSTKLPEFCNTSVFHINPLAIVANFGTAIRLKCSHCGTDLVVTPNLLKEIFPRISENNAERFADPLTFAFAKHKINTCNRVSHFFGQCEVECAGFTTFREVLNYTDGDRLWNTYRTALTAGLRRINPTWTQDEIESFAKQNLTHNDSKLGQVLFGDSQHPDRDYRGRGLLHVTWLTTYSDYKKASGVDVVADPTKLQNDPCVAADSAAWFWSARRINTPADANNARRVTHPINPAMKDFSRRKEAAKRAFHFINKGAQNCRENWDLNLTPENGW
ncbi:hypothetical protein PCE31106_02931 [Pandoraea cepalis]|uniref:Glycoside hydrolase family 19 catalytic domain-containing protein n=1 Tax=Pandoraea cepalis TaxID=2508294 RepID=A0A5E4W1D3_9BURK|nr:glycoside hydrolase family 19 protein [Pandoraea cepalis]VVE17090.1 hypothetical protein PCE31106_02931 [Pandoraea cepalis]